MTRNHLSRRDMLGLIGAAGAATLLDVRRGSAAGVGAPIVEPEPVCVVTPAETEGPYFVDERLERSDVRVDPTNGSIRPGTPLRLALTVARVDAGACTPVTGAHVDIWQCDAVGVYSDVRDTNGRFDTRGEKFLRGHQITDKAGTVEFLTVYPGWYAGRAVHIHFKVRLLAGGRRTYEFTSQLYFDDTVTDQVHAEAPYAAKGKRDVRNDRDGIYRNEGGARLVLPVVRQGQAYVGRFGVGLRMT